MSNVNVSVSGPAPVALRAPSAGPETEGLVLDIFHSFYRKSVSNEIVLRERARTPKPPRLRECDRSFRFPFLAIRIFAAPKRASDRPNQLPRVRRIQFALVFCSRLRCGSGNLCLREGLIVESLISQLQTTSENSFGSKVHPTARSSILGHRVSGNAIRSGGVPALIHAGKICRRRQGRDFHSARPRRLWKNPFSTSLLRSHYKGYAEVRLERRLKRRNGGGGSGRPEEIRPANPKLIAGKKWS